MRLLKDFGIALVMASTFAAAGTFTENQEATTRAENSGPPWEP